MCVRPLQLCNVTPLQSRVTRSGTEGNQDNTAPSLVRAQDSFGGSCRNCHEYRYICVDVVEHHVHTSESRVINRTLSADFIA